VHVLPTWVQTASCCVGAANTGAGSAQALRERKKENGQDTKRKTGDGEGREEPSAKGSYVPKIEDVQHTCLMVV